MFTQCRPWTRCPGAESSCTYSQLPGTTSDNLQYSVGQFKTGTHEVKGAGSEHRYSAMILSGNGYYFQIPNKSCFPASMSKREIKSLM